MFYQCAMLLEIDTNLEITEDVVKKAFRKQAVKFHPDVNKSPDAGDKFKEIKKAYDYMLNNYMCKPVRKEQGTYSTNQQSKAQYSTYKDKSLCFNVAYYNIISNGIAIEKPKDVSVYWITGSESYYSSMTISHKDFRDKKYMYENLDNYGRTGHYIESDDDFFQDNFNNIIRGLADRDEHTRSVSQQLVNELLECKNVPDYIKARFPKIISKPKETRKVSWWQ